VFLSVLGVICADERRLKDKTHRERERERERETIIVCSLGVIII